ncbi:hypothetical protein Pan216_44350 [Planctomycetes bacterium Pan216]|uniref:Uncharacterized protein n=1 Tax=Kolteria novifilia TaxID=2527975 RepID=A0A518B9A5_9BACT|nr:hypothetical protein Pan216_44350 [Planctomycetes bacterium Pan216]
MAEQQVIEKLIIRPWPKMFFLWPSAIFALFMSLAQKLAPISWQEVWGCSFLVVLAINLMVLTFEFPRATSLTVAVAVVAIVLGLLLLNHQFTIIEPLKLFIQARDVYASYEFYLFYFYLNGLLFAGMFCVTRFDYWELTPNSLVHHQGILGDQKRYPTTGLKLNKEISDVFEYLLAGAGRVVMDVPGESRPVVLENVLNIGRVERLSDQILDARMVRIEGTGGSSGSNDPNVHHTGE